MSSARADEEQRTEMTITAIRLAIAQQRLAQQQHIDRVLHRFIRFHFIALWMAFVFGLALGLILKP